MQHECFYCPTGGEINQFGLEKLILKYTIPQVVNNLKRYCVLLGKAVRWNEYSGIASVLFAIIRSSFVLMEP